MTERKRIALNVAATYGRSLLSVVLGIFSGRWILMALGDVDFGLFGVVGGMTAFITFVNSMLSASISRFYAYTIGKASVADDPQAGLEECRKWFNTALLIHTGIPILFMLVGYPVGEWAVHHFLNIPPDRITACAWVWRYTCIACLVGMVNVPFSAMYGAKQYIAEMTVYGMTRTVGSDPNKLLGMVPDRLVRHGGWHFSYLGGIDAVIEKRLAQPDLWLHAQSQVTADWLKRRIFDGRSITTQQVLYRPTLSMRSLPEYVVEQRKRYEKLFYRASFLHCLKLNVRLRLFQALGRCAALVRRVFGPMRVIQVVKRFIAR